MGVTLDLPLETSNCNALYSFVFSLLPQNGFSSVQPTPLQTTQAVEGKSLSVQWGSRLSCTAPILCFG